MEDPSQTVTRLVSQSCSQYPGGIRAVVATIRERDGERRRSESTLYADFNPNPTATGKLKVRDMMQAMSITGNHEALRWMASYYGYMLTSLSSAEPDAPTVESEMLQDYPAVVSFHEAVQVFMRGEVDGETVLARLDAAVLELRQTANLALRSGKGGGEHDR